MKKIIVILFLLLNGGLFSQNYNRGFHIILQGVDTSYFEENGLRWSEFSLTPKKYYKVLDLIESDTTCDCVVIRGNRYFMHYIKQTGFYKKSDRKFSKKVIAYLECKMESYEVFMWVDSIQGFGYLVADTLD